MFRFLLVALLLVSSFVKAEQQPSAQVIAQKLELGKQGLSSLQAIKTRVPPAQLMQQDVIELKHFGFDATSLPVTKREAHSNGVKSAIASDGTDVAILTYYQDVLMARVIDEGKAWSIVQTPTESFRYLSNELPQVFPKNDGKRLTAAERESGVSANAQQDDETPLPAGEMVTVDIYAVYTQAGIDLYGSDGVIARIAHTLDVTNYSYETSNVYIRANLLEATKVDYDPENEILTDPAHGALYDGQEFEAVRLDIERKGADFAVMFRPYVTGDDACGIAWMGGYPNEGQRFKPYMMVSHVSLDCQDTTLAHELGHNMGLVHSQRQDGEGVSFPYARGYGVDDEFVTIMAYEQAFNAPEIAKFSSPLLDCEGQPCGVNHIQDDGADAVKALNDLRHLMRDIRTRSQAVSGVSTAVIANGGGYVDATLDALDCGSTSICGGAIVPDTRVQLQAVPTPGERFLGWQGACKEAGTQPTCTVTVDAVKTVIANFSNSMPPGIDINYARRFDLLNKANNSDTVQIKVTDSYSVPFYKPFADGRVDGEAVLHSGYQDFNDDLINYSPNSSWLYLTFPPGEGNLSFWAKLDAPTQDTATATVQGFFGRVELNGDGEWHRYELSLSESHPAERQRDLSFYYRDGSQGGAGFDALLLDDIHFERADNNPSKILKVSLAGTGTIDITQGAEQASAANCALDCVWFVKSGAELTLTASAIGNNTFKGWNGVCAGQGQSCRLTISDDIELQASFDNNPAQVAGQLADWLDNSNLYLTTVYGDGTSTLWQGTEVDAPNSASAASLGAMGTAPDWGSIVTQLEGPGTLSFDWMSNIDDYLYDYIGGFTLYVNDERIAALNSKTEWLTESIELGSGSHYVEWRMASGWGNLSFPGDVFLDNVQWSGTDILAPRTLSIEVRGDGVVSSNEGVFCQDQCLATINANTVELTASPNEGMAFTGWDGACSGLEQVCRVDLEANNEVAATFAEQGFYEVTTTTSGSGAISPSSAVLATGEQAEFLIEPASGYEVSAISGCGGVQNGQVYRVGPISNDCEINAVFSLITYDVVFEVGMFGERVAGGELEQEVPEGSAAEAPEIVPLTGSEFVGWDTDFSSVTSDLTITAQYNKKPGYIDILLSFMEGGGSPLAAVQRVSSGSSITVPVTVDSGYQLSQQVGGNCPLGSWQAPLEYRVGPINNDCELTFNFEQRAQPGSGLLMLIMSLESSKERDDENK